MSSLSNILIFISNKGLKDSAFEKECELPNATLANKAKLKADLTSEIIDKISKRYKAELSAEGFHIVNIDPFGNERLVVLNNEEFERYEKRSSPAIEPKQKAQHEGQAKGIEERIKEIDDRTERIEASLTTGRTNQEYLLDFVTELLYRDCFREAKGNEEKAMENLNEILHRISPELRLRLKKSIGADGHNGGMENP